MFLDVLAGFIWGYFKDFWKKHKPQPECPLWALGYTCREGRPGGCKDCGRGVPKNG